MSCTACKARSAARRATQVTGERRANAAKKAIPAAVDLLPAAADLHPPEDPMARFVSFLHSTDFSSIRN